MRHRESTFCTCSGNGLPDWTLGLLHAHRVNEPRGACLCVDPPHKQHAENAYAVRASL
jgi:hypothetical protein